MRFYIPLLFLIIALSSCSDSRRLAKICERSPNICVSDTVVTDTFFTIREYKSIDTLKVMQPVDTFTIETERTKIQILKQYDTLRILTDTKNDTITEIRTEYVTKYKVKSDRKPLWIALVITTVLLLLLIRLLLRK